MNIKDLSKQQYEHLFEIDKIKRALFVAILEHNKLIRNQNLPKSKLRRIDLLIKDFKMVCFNVIRRNIESSDDYARYTQTLLIIASKIRTIIRVESRKDTAKDGFEKVYKLLPQSESRIESVFNGHSTIIVLFVIQVILIVGIFVNLVSILQNFSIPLAISLITLSVFSIIFSIFRGILYRKINNNIALDKIRRTIDKNIYFDKRIDANLAFDKIIKIITSIKWLKSNHLQIE